MKKYKKNYAFIDSQNVHLSIKHQRWRLDWKKLRVYLIDQYNVEKAFIFIGKIPKHQDIYDALQAHGYILIFKPTLKYKNGRIKGNVDAELVLHAMIQYRNYSRAVIITGDGDFHCLIKYLFEKKKIERLLVPNKNKFSALLRKFAEQTVYMSDLKNKLKLDRRTKRKV